MSASDISWIGSTEGFLLRALGLVAGPLHDYGHVRKLVWAGSFLLVTAIMMTSQYIQYWQLVLSL
jgi:hypothetical protein